MARILVVEDEPDIAMLLADDLRLEGHAVEVVTDGQTAGERGREDGCGHSNQGSSDWKGNATRSRRQAMRLEKHGRGVEQAWQMLDLFASLGAHTFDLTLTATDGHKRGFRPAQNLG